MTEHGSPFHFGNEIARLEIVFNESDVPERYTRDGHPNCQHHTNTHQLTPLPPTRESLKWGVKALLMYLKWEAVNNRHNDRFDEFKEFDPDTIDTDDENPRNSTIVFGALLSRTYRYGDEKEREEKEYVCSDVSTRSLFTRHWTPTNVSSGITYGGKTLSRIRIAPRSKTIFFNRKLVSFSNKTCSNLAVKTMSANSRWSIADGSVSYRRDSL